MEVYKLEKFEEDTVLSPKQARAQQGRQAPGMRAAKSSEFREREY